MTTDPTPTTHAGKAEAALRDYLPNTATAHALLAVAEQLRIRNLIALANGQLPERILDDPGYVDIQDAATKALVDIETHTVDIGLPDVPGGYVTAQLCPDIAAALGVQS